MKSEILLTLIKEVVKNEVKQQVKEEITKLIKSGAITLNKEKKQPSLIDLTESSFTASTKKQSVVPTQRTQQPIKQFTNNPILNEVLSQTTPFTAQQRAEGVMVNQSSVLDMIQPERYQEDSWETMDYRESNVPQQQIQTTDNSNLDAVTKALTRDYSELVKRFK